MSARSRLKVPRPPVAAKPTVGRHLRRIQRAAARRENGDLTALGVAAPLDPELRRLARNAARHHGTRNSAT